MLTDKGDTITDARVNGRACKVFCYGKRKDGTLKVYVIYPDGRTDRMYYRNGVMAYKA